MNVPSQADRSQKSGGKEGVEINRGGVPDMTCPSAHLHLNRMHLAALQRHRQQAEVLSLKMKKGFPVRLEVRFPLWVKVCCLLEQQHKLLSH